MRILACLVSSSAAVLAMAAATGCGAGGPGGSGSSGRSPAGTTPAWARSLGSGVTVTPPGAYSAGSPGAVLAGAIADMESRSYAKICGYLQPSQQPKCGAEFGSAHASAMAAAMPVLKRLAVSYTATDGARALVGMTGTICSQEQTPACVTNKDPAAIFDSGKTFAVLWTEAVTSTADAYSLTPMTEIGGKWYGYSSGF